MLPKQNRANKKDINKIFKDGSFLNSTNLTFKFFIENGVKEPRISFITPKSINKKAVMRNKLRRIGYKALKKINENVPSSVVGVFIFKKYQENIFIIQNEIKTILYKIH